MFQQQAEERRIKISMKHFRGDWQEICHFYLIIITSVRCGDSLSDLHISCNIVFAVKEFALIEQTVHGEQDVELLQLPPDVSFSKIRVDGVMHHHQDPRFRSWK